jgi:hypothetical protein
MNILNNYINNRYYDRETKNTCYNTYLDFNRNYGNDILSYNNPYVNQTPSFSQYLTFSNFNERTLTLDDINTILSYYNKNYLNSESEYGPFNQVNLNIVGQMKYNEKTWDTYWKNYTSNTYYKKSTYSPDTFQLQDISYYISIKFVNKMNSILALLNNKTTLFKLSKHQIINIFRSSKTENIKFKLNIVLTRNTKSKAYTFEVIGYYNPITNFIENGKAVYIGTATTDTILLASGYDNYLYEGGRPLYKSEYKKSSLMSDEMVRKLFLEKINKDSYKYNDELPYWYKVFTGR